MSLKSLLAFLILLVYSHVSAQQKINIEGKISSENELLTDAIVELKINKISKFAVTNSKGIYKFSNIIIIPNDSLFLKVNHFGFQSHTQNLNNIKESNIFDVKLIVSEPKKLDEVVIVGKEKIINTARKSSYKIDNKDFIKNAKAAEVLSTVPNIYYNEFQGGAIVDGKLEAKIFIDGMEMMNEELKTIDASSIDRVEVMNNPSAAYGSEFSGAIINIITKKKREEFIKGSLGTTVGLKNDFLVLDPAFSCKKGRLIIKSNFSYLENTSKVDYNSFRMDNNGIFTSGNLNNSKSNRQYSQTRINVELTKKSNLTFTNYLYQTKYIANANGISSLNNTMPIFFSKEGENSNKQWNIASVFKYKPTEDRSFFAKASYAIFNKKDENTFYSSNSLTDYYNIISKNKEASISVNYEVENLTIFKKESSFYSDLKFINRNYEFSNTIFYINQNIVNASIELDSKWSEKVSTEATVAVENTNNSNTTVSHNYTVLLPTFTAFYHFDNKIDTKLSYSRKILRPSPNDLNDAILIIYPGVAKQGNSMLSPQIRNYYSVTISKPFKSDNVSFKFYNESINDAIVEIYKPENDLIIQTLSNAARFNSLGINMGIRTKLFKKIIANLNSGFDYNTFHNDSPSAIIKKSSGYTFRGSLNLNTKLFKDKVSVSFSGRQNGPEYTLLSKRTTKPYLDFSITTNIIKDKLNIQLYGQQLLGKAASGFSDLSSYNNFYQRIDTKNNSSNLLLILTYNFGKKFNDRIDDNNIENSDVRR